MALIKCVECGQEISDKAAACPKCGAPIASASQGKPTQIIEQTSKPLKLQYALAATIFFIGLVWGILNYIYAMNTQQSISLLPLILVIIGAIWAIVTKIRIWWHHK